MRGIMILVCLDVGQAQPTPGLISIIPSLDPAGNGRNLFFGDKGGMEFVEGGRWQPFPCNPLPLLVRTGLLSHTLQHWYL